MGWKNYDPINRRFWNPQCEITVDYPIVADRSEWPKEPGSKTLHRRRAVGLEYFLREAKVDGRLDCSGTLTLAGGRVRAEWFLWSEPRKPIAYAGAYSTIAIRYRGEIFERGTRPTTFGIHARNVWQRFAIVLEPSQFDGAWGVYPDDSRTRLLFTTESRRGGDIPIVEWGQEFVEKMPEEIRAALNAEFLARIEEDLPDEYRKALASELARLYSDPIKRISGTGSPSSKTDGEVAVSNITSTDGSSKGNGKGRTPRRPIPAKDGGDQSGAPGTRRLDIPDRFWDDEGKVFDDASAAAMWAPVFHTGRPTVILNPRAVIFRAFVDRHVIRWPGQEEQIERIARAEWGHTAVCKVAHARRHWAGITREDLDTKLLTPESLTLALMGMRAEDALMDRRMDSEMRQMRRSNAGS